MRYHSTAPLFNCGQGFSSQRSEPTCSLSLANVSASGTLSSNREAQIHDMEIDSVNTLVPVIPTEKRGAIPFPKRPHSLLRSTPPSPASRPHATSISVQSKSSAAHECEEEEGSSAHDQDPPRKRTRTSAISTSTRTRSRRVLPLPPSPRPQSTPPSPVFKVPRFPSPSSRSSSHTRPSTPSILRRRRASPEETATSLRLYKMLLCGLEVKYGGQQNSSRTSSATAYLEAVLKDTRSSLDVQDSLLAQRLRTWLVINGVDMRQVSIDIENDSLTSSSSSYQRHFASALLRHQNRLSSRALRVAKRPLRQASSLAVEYGHASIGRRLE